MAKEKVMFQCTNCGATFPRWMGRCTSCGEWNTLEEIYSQPKVQTKKNITSLGELKILPLTEIAINSNLRIPTNISEFDRVLGGGFIPGSVVLIAGEPGIGKSTLVLQIFHSLSTDCIYISGEESLEQIKLRSQRLNVSSSKIGILCETNLDTILNVIENSEANFFSIDSIQTLYSESNPSLPGSLYQIRESTLRLIDVAKRTNKVIILIGHINKEGNIAGPKVLEHIVDCVLTLEGERNLNLRLLRPLKNRFGSTFEIGLFEMTQMGLLEIAEPSKILISNSHTNTSGIAFSAFVEGARCFITEIQSLVTPTSYNIPQRNVNGYDFKRLQMILAVLDKKLKLNFRNNDVFVNITGGISINDTSIDLAVASSLFSSYNDVVIPKNVAIIGEIGLTGEVRNVHYIDKRVKELEKFGFETVILPRISKESNLRGSKAKLIFVDRVVEAFDRIFG